MTAERTEDEVRLAVLYGRMSLEEGVAWGMEHGYPFKILPTSEIAAFQSAAWTVEQGIGWIAWRTDEGGAQSGALLRYWGSGLLNAAPDSGQRENLSDAKALLWNALIDGTITATGIVGPRSMRSKILPRSSIPATDWIDLEWAPEGLSRHVLQSDKQWIDVRLPASELRKLWPTEISRSPDSNAVTKSKDKGGATPQYDEVDFLIEAFRILYEDGRSPASQADLNRRATDAYAAAKGLPAGKPSIEWGRENIRRLWVGLGLERPKRPQ